MASELLFKSKQDLVCHCLLIECKNKLVLVDTGFGLEDCREPIQRLGAGYKLIGPKLDKKETAIEQIKRLGFSPSDVRDIIVTHLDLDHAGGISDFPEATVHIMQDEHEHALHHGFSIKDFQRYRKNQWQNHKHWKFHNENYGEEWLGFHKIRPLDNCDDEILLIPLRGHTKGHAGIAIQTRERWLFHAGDCFYSHASISLEQLKVPKSLAAFEALLAYDNDERLQNVEKLRQLKKDYRNMIDIFSAHDTYDFQKLSQKL